MASTTRAANTAASEPKANGRPGNGQTANGRARAAGPDPKVLLDVLNAVRKGDFSWRAPKGKTGTAGKIYEALNEIIEKNEMLTAELGRISEVVGKEGKILPTEQCS